MRQWERIIVIITIAIRAIKKVRMKYVLMRVNGRMHDITVDMA